jgi:hypothetical protein
MFPQNVIVTHLPGKHRSMLLVDRIIWVSIMLCRSKQKDGRFFWVIQPDERERDYVTVLCTMNSCHNRVLDFYVLPRMSRHALLRRDVSWLREGVRLGKLSDFYSTVKRLWAQRGKQNTLSRYLQEL